MSMISPNSRKRLGLGLVVTVVLGASVFYIGKPWTREQCIVEAANMPTDYGSAVMYRHCDELFAQERPKPWEIDWDQYTPLNEGQAGSVTGNQGFTPPDVAASEETPRDLFEEAAKASGQTVDGYLKKSR